VQFPSAVAHYGSINNITYYDEVVKNNDSEEKKNTAIKRKVLPKFGTDYTNAEARQVLRAFDLYYTRGRANPNGSFNERVRFPVSSAELMSLLHGRKEERKRVRVLRKRLLPKQKRKRDQRQTRKSLKRKSSLMMMSVHYLIRQRLLPGSSLTIMV